MVSRAVQFRFMLILTSWQLAGLSVNASVSRDIRTRGMLEGVVATRRTSGQIVGPRVCSYVLVTLEVNLARN